MDHTGALLDSLSSPLRPTKPIKELKSIVTYLTQTSLEQLENAPSLTDILPQVLPFLGENTVLI